MATQSNRRIDPELMNLHGVLAPDPPLEDLARYQPGNTLGSIAPVTFHDDSSAPALPPLPPLPALQIERAPRPYRDALAFGAGALVVAGLLGSLLAGRYFRPLPPSAASHQTIVAPDPASVPIAGPAIGASELAVAPAHASEPVERNEGKDTAPVEGRVFVLPTVEIVGWLRGAPPATGTSPKLVEPATDERAVLAQLPTEINRAAAATAIAVAARGAARCVDAGEGTNEMPVRVTFAPSGRVTTATIEGGPFVGLPAGGCIAGVLRSATVGAFEGVPVTLHTSIRIR